MIARLLTEADEADARGRRVRRRDPAGAAVDRALADYARSLVVALRRARVPS